MKNVIVRFDFMIRYFGLVVGGDSFGLVLFLGSLAYVLSGWVR